MRKEYISGLLEKVEVDLDNKINTHILSLYFKNGLVGDKIQYKNHNDKSKGYDIIEGKKETVFEVSLQENKGRKKKKSTIPPLKTNPSPWNSGVRG